MSLLRLSSHAVFRLLVCTVFLPLFGYANGDKPNVLWIIADDFCTRLPSYGDTDARMPNLERLSGESLIFNKAYVQYPVCNPSRNSFLTGWRPDRTTILDNRIPLRKVFPDVITLPQLFRQSGYQTGGIGKIFHKGLNEAGKEVLFEDPKSFDHFADYLRQTTARGKRGEGRNLTAGVLGWCNWLAAEGDDRDQPDGMAAADAVRWLGTVKDTPFFLAVGLHKPHDPFHAPHHYFDLYPEESIEIHRIPHTASPDLPLALPAEKTTFARFTDQERREFKRAYYACMSFMDAQVGKLLDRLEEQDLDDNTIVIFMSDHGYHLGEHGWWNKVTVFELGTQIPFIVRVPGKTPEGLHTEAIVEAVDIYPTLIDLCDLTAPHPLDGESFAHVLDHPQHLGKQAAYSQVTRGRIQGRSVRTQHWRYTEWDYGREGVELYAHPDDRLEYHNLAGSPRLAAVQQEMQTLLDEVFPRQ